MAEEDPSHPTSVTGERGWFDRLADTVSDAAAKPPFFFGCLALVGAWLVAGALVGFSHGWVDLAQTVATLVTLLVVALLENEEWRGNKATQRKLNAIASALAELMERVDVDGEQARQLNASVGVEKRESTSRGSR